MIEYSLPSEERSYLRGLAARQAELAALPVMAARKALWQGVNDGHAETRPPFAIESWTFARDFMPPGLFQCTSDLGRRLEHTFLTHIRHHEILNDDHVCPDAIEISWQVWQDEFGIEIPTDRAADVEGVETGYHFDCPIKDLARDGYDMVKPAAFGVNRENTLAYKAFLEETFGDVLPVRLAGGVYANNCITQRLMRLMSMETFFMAMYDCPDKLHGLMGLLRDNAKRMARWAEAEGLLVVNNGNQCTCGTCLNFTTLLPKGPEPRPGEVKLTDMWAGMDSQETVGISPEMFAEFVYPYYEDLASLYGLVYWGCCEPADPIWGSIGNLPNLRAISISRWADQQRMAEALDGREIVFSRKPDPNFLSVDEKLNEDAWAKEIRSTLQAVNGKDVPLQMVVRDVYTLHGDLNNARRAVDVARSEIDTYYPALGA